MLRSRLIPCLLIHEKGLVKTVKFKDPKYVGDPLNAVKIFNEKEVDELSVFDIDASILGKEPDYALINNLATQCRMPLCYGGGVKTSEQALRILSLGVEKVAFGSAAIENPDLLQELSGKVGRQSVVVVMDIRKKLFGKYELVTHNGKRSHKVDPILFARKMEEHGAGEIVVNSVDADGTMKGYDHDLIRSIFDSVGVPVTALGGAGSIEHIRQLVSGLGTIGAGAGSLFVFKGVYRAVLINYPSRSEKLKALS